MKSFSQFLQESYLSEEEADQLRLFKKNNKEPYNFKKNIGNRGISTDPIKATKRLPASGAETPKVSPGQQEIRQTSNPPTTKALEPGKPGAPLATRGTNPQAPPESLMRGAYDAANKSSQSSTTSSNTSTKPPKTPPKPSVSVGKPPSGAAPSTRYSNVGGGRETINVPKQQPSSSRRPFTPQDEARIRQERAAKKAARSAAYDARQSANSSSTRSTSNLTTTPSNSTSARRSSSSALVPSQSAAREAEKSATKTGMRSGAKGILKGLGKVVGPASAALDVADERSKGSGWARSLAKGAAVAAGGALGGAAGSVAGPVGSIGGATAGSMAASKAFDVAAGANAKERAAMRVANRQRQAGSSLKGIGGSTSFSQKKPGGPAFMSTGVGKQRKTVELAKTGVVQRGGQSTAGHLAFKGGQAVYKAGPSAQSLAKTSSNPLERIGRSLFAGAYKKHDTAKAKQALQTAQQSDIKRSQKLGVKYKPGG